MEIEVVNLEKSLIAVSSDADKYKSKLENGSTSSVLAVNSTQLESFAETFVNEPGTSRFLCGSNRQQIANLQNFATTLQPQQRIIDVGAINEEFNQPWRSSSWAFPLVNALKARIDWATIEFTNTPGNKIKESMELCKVIKSALEALSALKRLDQ